MLSKPEYGWSDFSLGEKVYQLSYLTDVSKDWLRAAIYGQENLVPFSVNGFCEPGRMLCTISYWNCYIMLVSDDKDGTEYDNICVEQCNISMLDFCLKLYDDIYNNLDAWADWDVIDGKENEYNEEVYRNTTELKSMLNKLQELIEKRKNNFGEKCCFF